MHRGRSLRVISWLRDADTLGRSPIPCIVLPGQERRQRCLGAALKPCAHVKIASRIKPVARPNEARSRWLRGSDSDTRRRDKNQIILREYFRKTSLTRGTLLRDCQERGFAGFEDSHILKNATRSQLRDEKEQACRTHVILPPVCFSRDPGVKRRFLSFSLLNFSFSVSPPRHSLAYPPSSAQETIHYGDRSAYLATVRSVRATEYRIKKS